PQPNGEIPETAVARLKEIGQWLKINGETIYNTTAGDFPAQSWGAATRNGNDLYIHILDNSVSEITIPINDKITDARTFPDNIPVNVQTTDSGTILIDGLPSRNVDDFIIKLQLRK
ncbi:MAG: alpha-L-fucosidase, partial [Paramuribaculum sp.]|nr:alpha-L-fucosidase [Paramuribaculum sp.]